MWFRRGKFIIYGRKRIRGRPGEGCCTSPGGPRRAGRAWAQNLGRPARPLRRGAARNGGNLPVEGLKGTVGRDPAVPVGAQTFYFCILLVTVGIWVKWFGCPKAFYEARKVEEKFGRAESPEKAEFCLIYTCAVKRGAEKKSIRAIEEALKKCHKVIVTGCLVDVLREKLRIRFPTAVFVRTKELFKFFGIAGEEKIAGPVFKNSAVAVVPIAEGCNFACTYCATKIARGWLKPYAPEKIIEAVKGAVEKGAKIIWLTAEDVAAYRRGKYSLLDLLEEIADAVKSHDVKIRIGMGNPRDFWKYGRKLLDVIYEGPFFKMLHIPIQSGSERILKLMGRAGTLWPYRMLVKRARAVDENFSIWTDVIVGFPGETEEDFEKTVELIERTIPDKVNISIFSPRPGTPAKLFEQKFGVDERIKKNRSRKLAGVAAKVYFLRKRNFLGRKLCFTGEEKGQARDRYYNLVAMKDIEPGSRKCGKIIALAPGYMLATDK